MEDLTPRRLWPWLVGLAVVAVAVWLTVVTGERQGPPDLEPPPVEDPAGVPAPATPVPDTGAGAAAGEEPTTAAAAEDVVARTEAMRAAVRRYEEDCAARLEPAAGVGTGGVVTECIRRLRGAIDAVAAADTVGDVAVGEQLWRYRERAERLRSTPPGEDRVGPTREVLRSVAEVLATIQEERYPASLEVDEVLAELRSTAESLDPDRSLAAQQDRTHRFFLQAGALLSAMARPGDPGPEAPE